MPTSDKSCRPYLTSAAEHAAYAPPGRMTDLGDWRWNKRFVRSARLAQARRPEIELALTNAANWSVDGLAVARLGFWESETGLSRFPDTTGKTNVAFAADIVYNVFLTLTADLTNGCSHRIATPAREALDFIRDPQTPSPFIKVNQVGYLPDARQFRIVFRHRQPIARLPSSPRRSFARLDRS